MPCVATVLNVIGQQVMEQVQLTGSADYSRFIINTQHLKNGVYIIQLRVAEKWISKKVMVSHH
jgi:hypothetical protein